MTDDDSTVPARMRTGTAVFGDTQQLPGYSVLLHDGDADHLTDLPRPERLAFLEDLMLPTTPCVPRSPRRCARCSPLADGVRLSGSRGPRSRP